MEWKAPSPRPGSQDRPIYIDAVVEPERPGGGGGADVVAKVGWVGAAGRRSGGRFRGRWPAVVAIHAVLLVFAVAVVWATLGSDPKGSASAAVTGSAAGRMAPHLPAAAETDRQVAGAGVARGAAGPFLQDDRPRVEEAAWSDRGEDAAEGEEGAAGIVRAASVRQTAVAPAAAAVLPGAETEVEPRAEGAPTGPGVGREAVVDYSTSGQLYGLPGAKRVVYVVDASGSLVDGFPFILDELRRCITSLRPEQAYAVVFFRGSEVVEAQPMGMVRAETHALARTVRWLDPARQPLVPRGTARPDAALRRAMAYRPDAVVLISDDLTGRVDPEAERRRLLHLIELVNRDGVPIHTAQLRGRDPLATPERLGTLELIAFATGGTHRYIREAELSTDPALDLVTEPPAIRF